MDRRSHRAQSLLPVRREETGKDETILPGRTGDSAALFARADRLAGEDSSDSSD